MISTILAQGGGGGGGGIPWSTVIQVLIVFGALAISAIGWIVRQMQEAKQKREAAQRRRLAQEAAAREGLEPRPLGSAPPLRPEGPVPHDEARRRLQELAERRRRELEQMRQRGQGSPPLAGDRPDRPVIVLGPGAPPTPAGPATPPLPPRPRPAMTPPVSAPSPAAALERELAARRERAERQRREQEERQRQAQRERERQERQRRASGAKRPAAPASPFQSAPPAPALGRPAVGAGTALGIELLRTRDGRPNPAGMQELRRAIVMAEILNPPVALRPPREPGIGGGL